MTVGELVDKLSKHDRELEVVVCETEGYVRTIFGVSFHCKSSYSVDPDRNMGTEWERVEIRAAKGVRVP